jgi:glycosyltransferase involved in cell wall biosynthesis
VTPSASVVVCTHNRSASLGQALLSLLRCSGTEGEFEVLVVDNASTDDTAAVVERLEHQHPDRELRYVYEPRLGLHYARHAGARAARSPLLLYTDDDVEAHPGWIRAYVEAFARHPEMVVAGGPALPSWEAEPPPWVLELASATWACLPLALIDRGPEFQLVPDGHFFGVNMAIRAQALRRFGGFRPELVGSASVGSGEWGLLLAVRRGGLSIGWVPDARVCHRVPRSRMQPGYFERWSQLEAAARMFERWHQAPRGVRSITRDLARIVRSNWRLWARAARVRRGPDAGAISIRSDARRGIYELFYLWQIVTSRELRAFLDAERFGP